MQKKSDSKGLRTRPCENGGEKQQMGETPIDSQKHGRREEGGADPAEWWVKVYN